MRHELFAAVIERARLRAAESGAIRFLVAFQDDEYQHGIRICGEDYVDSPEFFEFDGRILAAVHPCGKVE